MQVYMFLSIYSPLYGGRFEISAKLIKKKLFCYTLHRPITPPVLELIFNKCLQRRFSLNNYRHLILVLLFAYFCINHALFIRKTLDCYGRISFSKFSEFKIIYSELKKPRFARLSGKICDPLFFAQVFQTMNTNTLYPVGLYASLNFRLVHLGGFFETAFFNMPFQHSYAFVNAMMFD